VLHVVGGGYGIYNTSMTDVEEAVPRVLQTLQYEVESIMKVGARQGSWAARQPAVGPPAAKDAQLARALLWPVSVGGARPCSAQAAASIPAGSPGWPAHAPHPRHPAPRRPPRRAATSTTCRRRSTSSPPACSRP
jgi:hypothetical protein